MRGKKTDSEFLSSFISECVQKGMETTSDIVTHARSMIKDIDQEIQRVERQKVVRSKLLDVIATFDSSSKTSKSSEVRALSFFKIQNPIICKHICDILKKKPTEMEGFLGKFPKEEIIFCIKQLIEHKVIHKSNNVFLRGDAFEDYNKFVLMS